MSAANFLMITCQVGAEAALKAELARELPVARFSFSRPGFVTFKLPEEVAPSPEFQLRSIFARTWSFSLGRVEGNSTEDRAKSLWDLAAEQKYEALHVWQRDQCLPGEHGFEPGVWPLAAEAEQEIRKLAPPGHEISGRPPAPRNSRVLDCVLVEEDQWWTGYHWANSMVARWPGGVLPVERPEAMVSRAYLKMREGLAWSQLPIRPDDEIAELGCAPGGAAQALLEQGLFVFGIDPAEVDPAVAEHPHFAHVRKRASDVKRREFRDIRWLTADINVAPTYTLDAVESIVAHHAVSIKGMLLTLKLLDWKMADDLWEHAARVRSWGFRDVRIRQLAHNRQEVTLAALRNRALRRVGRAKKR